MPGATTSGPSPADHFDLIVIGGGIAGVSIAYELAADRSVCLLEMESSLAFHTTGRSAASFLETYGNFEIQALTTASRAFYEDPPDFFDGPLLTPRPLLQFAPVGRGQAILDAHSEVVRQVPDAVLLTPAEAKELFPLAAPGHIEVAMLEPGAMELDVHGIHQGYVRGLRARAGSIIKTAKVVDLVHAAGSWTVATADGTRRTATTVVNAAGAWGDVVGEMAGVKPVGLTPLRRSVFMLESPAPLTTRQLPVVADIDWTFYIKPEGDQLLCSPADETPTPPSDAKADQLEIARAMDAIREATTLRPKSVRTAWAGLRTFAPDRNFVVGPDPDQPSFIWFVGQGGYGLQAAPAAARVGAELVRTGTVPTDVTARGLDIRRLSPSRPELSQPIT